METQNQEPQKPLLLRKEGKYVYITNRTIGKTIRFDLVTKNIERKHKRRKVWEPVKHQYNMFKNLGLRDIEYEDPKFKKLLELAISTHKKERSLSTYLSTLEKVLPFEQWIQQGFECSVSYYNIYEARHLPSVSELPKDYLEMLKTKGETITPGFRYNKEENKMWTEVMSALKILDLQNDVEVSILASLNSYRVKDAWDYLVEENNFQPRALIGYCANYLYKFEGLAFSEAITILRDYYRMAKTIGRNVKKYPKYLRSMHDIIQANYNAYKKEYDEKIFHEVIDPELEYTKSKEYIMINPTSPKDIVQEGTDNNHCVGSYVDDIISKKTYIMFMRKKDNKDEPEQSKKSLITVELDLRGKKLIQARGSYNRAPTKEEREFLEEYAKKKELEVTI